MIKWVKDKGKELMMVIIIQNSNRRRVMLSCENFGEHKSQRIIRKSSSKKCNCPFVIEGFRIDDAETSINRWENLYIISGVHYHFLAIDFSAHSFMGRMTPEQVDVVRRWTYMMMIPSKIVSEMRKQFPGNATSTKQVNNFRYKMNVEDRGELTTTEKVSTRREHPSGEVDILLFVHLTSLHLLNLFPYVSIIDDTYKTNRYLLLYVNMCVLHNNLAQRLK
ncbi:hypothetical protein V2J09_018591 [Rumex salicifolius]